MSAPNPLYIAQQANNMARNAKGGRGIAFEKVATVSMCMVAVMAGMQMLMQLWRDLRRDNHRSR